MNNQFNKTNKGIVKIWLGEDGMIYIYLGGELGMDEVKKFIEEKLNLLKNVKEKTRVFCDLRDVVWKGSFSLSLAVRARRLIIQELKKIEQEKVERMAILGASSVLKMIGFFVGGALGIKEVKYFTDKEKSLKWLKE